MNLIDKLKEAKDNNGRHIGNYDYDNGYGTGLERAIEIVEAHDPWISVGSLWDTMFHMNDDYSKTKEGAFYWTDIEGQLEEGTLPSELVDPVHLDKSRKK